MKRSLEKRNRMAGYTFLAPWIFASIFLLFFPLVFSLLLSFSDLLNVTNYKMNFVGFDNFQKAFISDIKFLPLFWQTVKETLINTPLIVVFSLLIAMLISKKIKARGFFRSVFFLPVMLGTGFVMAQLLGQNVDKQAMEVASGILLPPQIQSFLGPELSKIPLDFLNRITLILWQSGVQIIIALAGIQRISISLYESARIDSATEWEIFWKITLPMISPILLLNTVYTVLESFTNSQNSMVSYLVNTAFKDSNFEYAAAMGWIYFIFILLLIGVVFLIIGPFASKVSDT